MEKVLEFIKSNHLIKSDEIIGVAVSGGRDSMALLNFLNSIADELNIKVVGINIDHCLRPTSASESEFVKEFCDDNKIHLYNFKVDAMKISIDQKIGIEAAARQARYGVFEALIKKGVVDKIALGHHVSDQVETVLENIFRGTGLAGAKGMDPLREDIYIRPFLETSREEINKYVADNSIPYVDDESNLDVAYTRNFIRNQLMPLIKQRFKNVEKNILSFSKSCAEDNEYINSMIVDSGIMVYKNTIKIPLVYFDYPTAIINRILLKHLNSLSGTIGNIERKHISIMKSFAREGKNGMVINLPNGIKAHKEYDYITITTGSIKKMDNSYNFKTGKIHISGFGEIKVSQSKLRTPTKNGFIIDADEIPSTAVWRFRQDGDNFKPYGAEGSKKLNDYFIDKKIPLRVRDNIPVLALGNEIFIVADIEISDKVKVTDKTNVVYKVTFDKDII